MSLQNKWKVVKHIVLHGKEQYAYTHLMQALEKMSIPYYTDGVPLMMEGVGLIGLAKSFWLGEDGRSVVIDYIPIERRESHAKPTDTKPRTTIQVRSPARAQGRTGPYMGDF